MLGKKLINPGAVACTTDKTQILDGGTTQSAALYRFEDNVNDTTGSYNASDASVTFTNKTTAAPTYNSSGKFGKSAIFNGSTSAIKYPDDFWKKQIFSISCWFKADDVSSTYQTLFSGYSNDGTHKGFVMAIDTNKISYVHGITVHRGSTTLSNSTWYHFVLVLDGSEARGYLNGVLDLTVTGITSVTYQSSGQKFFTGIRPQLPGSNYAYGEYDGEIDQMRFFEKALNLGEIDSLYNETATSAALSGITNPSTVAYYKMADATDETGSYNGTPTNVDFNVQGKYGFAGKFNGSNAYIDLPLSTSSLFDGKNTLAVSFWFKTTTTARQRMFTDYAQTSRNCDIIIDAGNIEIETDYNQSTNLKYTSSSTYNDGNWHHLVVALNQSAGQRTIYIDGSLVNTGTLSSNSWSGTGQKVTLGAFYSSSSGYSQYFDGSIDQVRIFNKAISASEVTKLYTEIQCANTIDTPESYFNTKLYTGNDGTQSITGVGFAPGMTWIKARSVGYTHSLQDTLRGPGTSTSIYPDLNSSQGTYGSYGQISAFGDDGFTVASGGHGVHPVAQVNKNGVTYASWNWKAASSSTNNNDGNIASTVRASQESGFSIVTYSPNNTVGMSIGHGLSKAPSLVITKRLDAAQEWGVYTNVSTNNTTTNWLSLDDSDGYGSGSFMTLKSTTLELPQTGAYWSSPSSNQVAYCFANIDGYQRIGSYVGNNSTNGPFVYTGFEPAWLMVKRTDADGNSWAIFDNKRVESDGDQSVVFADTASAESDYDIDFTANGFIIKATTTNLNASGGNYMFLSIAANPDNTAPTKANSFEAKIYTGNGSARSITDIGFKPDFVWIKKRANDTKAHRLFDSVRGPNSVVYSNLTNVAGTPTDELTAFIDGGFSLGTASAVNDGASDTYVAWNWKGLDHDRNLATINNNGSTISLVSANPEAGFSVVQYTTTANFQQFGVGHGLSSAPQIIFQKKYGPSSTSASDWYVMTTVVDGSVDYLKLNATDAKTDMAGSYANFQLGNSTFSDWWTGADQDIINYCFHSVAGYSKIDKYSGSGVSGKEVTLDFSPSFVLIKRTNAVTGWIIVDDQRGTKELYPHVTNIEDTTTTGIVLGTNKFTLNTTGSWYNASGGIYLYMAFK